MPKNTKVLITGGCGFIGSNLIILLMNHPFRYRIAIMDNLDSGKIDFIKPYLKKIKLYKTNIANQSSTSKAFEQFRPDVVIHLAAKHFIPECNSNPAKTYETNVFGTKIVVDLCNKYKVKHLIFSSSAAVYEPVCQLCTENSPTEPDEWYGLSKLTAEYLIKKVMIIPWTVFRLTNIFGLNETHPHFIENITNQIHAGQKIIKVGNLNSYRDYLYIDDLTKIIEKSIQNKKLFNQIINIGTAKPISGHKIIKVIQGLTRQRFRIKQEKHLLRKADRPYLGLANNKIRKIIPSLKLFTDIKHGLIMLLKYKGIRIEVDKN